MAELKARISLSTDQFKRALADVTKAANKATKDIGGIGRAAGIAGKAVGVGALALGAVLVGKNAKAFTEVRNASVALGASVATVSQRILAIAPTFAKAFSSGKGALTALKNLGLIGSSSLKLLGNSFSLVTAVAKGFASRIISSVSSALGAISKIGAVVGAAALAIGGALAFGIKGAVEFGASLANLSARTGAPVKDLVILQKAFASVGIEPEKVGSAINKMQKALSGVNEEGKPTINALKSLGLTIESLRGKTPTEQFAAISTALSKIKDPADRAAIAMDLFGKSGGELNALFQNPDAIKNAQQALGGQADLLAKNAEKFHHVAEALANIGDKLRGFFVGIASGLVDKLTALADVLNGIDLSGFGKRIGDSISSAVNIVVNAFKQGKLGELVGLTLKAGFATAGDYLIGVIQVAIKILAQSIGVIFSIDFFSAIELGFAGVALKVAASFVEAFSDVTSFVAAGLSVGFQKALEILNKFTPFFTNLAAYFVAAIRTGIQKVIDLLPSSFQPEGFKAQTFQQNFDEEKSAFVTPSDFKAQSFSDAFAEQKKTYQPEFVKGLNGLADETLSAAAAAFGSLGSKIAEIFKNNIGDFKPGDIFHSAEVRSELESLAKSLNIPIETVKKAAEKIAASTNAKLADPKSTKHVFKTDADQFARIGLFARATHTPGLDYHRQTAHNTGRLVGLFEAHLSREKAAVAG